jgi:hypothetical protein
MRPMEMSKEQCRDGYSIASRATLAAAGQLAAIFAARKASLRSSRQR